MKKGKEYYEVEAPCNHVDYGITKRSFIKIITGFLLIVFFELKSKLMEVFTFCDSKDGLAIAGNSDLTAKNRIKQTASNYNLGVEKNGKSKVYFASDNTPEKNMDNILRALGGIKSIIGEEDIVILKPNAQWWAQGMTNTNAMKAFIKQVLSIPGFKGEIIIAENHQYANPDSRGWTTDQPNGDFNYNQLVDYFNKKGFRNVSKYHWRCAGPNPNPIEGDDELGSKIVTGPGEGDGYVWSDKIIYQSPLHRRCLLTWPVFTSAYSGVTIDFKNGAWENGQYTGQPVKFINFSAINHHTKYGGVTASVKNYMGIVDMSCGFQGSTPKNLFNTHFIGIRQLSIPYLEKLRPYRVRKKIQDWIFSYNHENFNHTGGVLGKFMKDVRFADLNFITAHWVGWGHRTRIEKSAYPKVLLASKDPVAVDYVAAKEVLHPLTLLNEKENLKYYSRLNDPEDKNGPFYRFLLKCHEEGIGNIDPKLHKVIKIV